MRFLNPQAVRHTCSCHCAPDASSERGETRERFWVASLRKRWRGARALALPFVVFAQQRLVLLHLRFQFAESLLATGANIVASAGGMKHSRRQRQIQRKRTFFAVRIFRKDSVQNHQIGFITFQNAIQLVGVVFYFLFRWLMWLDVLVADGKFHGCTCRSICGRGGRRGTAFDAASWPQHTSARRARQSRIKKK